MEAGAQTFDVILTLRNGEALKAGCEYTGPVPTVGQAIEVKCGDGLTHPANVETVDLENLEITATQIGRRETND